MPKTITIRGDYHKTQRKVFLDKTRFKVCFCGRRWGKTAGGVRWMPEQLYKKPTKGRKPRRLGWWVAPTYRQAKIAFRYFRMKYGRTGLILKTNKTDLSIELVLGRVIEFRSADQPENLRGEGVDVLVLDEFASMPEMVWTEILRATLMDNKGEALFIGTPKGMNWAYTLWAKGLGGDPQWKSWKFSTYDNPYIDADEVRASEEDMPEVVALQEIHAEPQEDAGSVFRNVDELSILEPEEPAALAAYMMGTDLAKYRDFTVNSVVRGQRQVFMERFNKIDWAVQKKRITAAAERHNNAEVILDSTGVGDPIYEDLFRSGVHIEPYQLNNRTKRELIDNLIVKLDKKELLLLNDPVQKAELKSYAYDLTSSGKLRMNAPAGKHDDTVIALALAVLKQPVVPYSTIISGAGSRPTKRF